MPVDARQVEGLVGDQAAARLARAETDAEGSAAQLRMTVADDGDESESARDFFAFFF